tara:strand:- start:88 stop:498 length:411 start_codon:yes stop_codon:yes gene_type:complete
MKILVVFFAVTILSGCIGNTVPTQNSTLVQAGLWKTENYRTPGDNTGVLIINRDAGYRGSSCIPLISLNREQIAPLNIGEKLVLHVTGGRHLLRAHPNRNCAASPVETFVEIKSGQTTNYRFGFQDRTMVFTPVAY